jgi:hypothetical protein
LAIPEACDRRKSLSSAEQWPPAYDVAVYWLVDFEKRSCGCHIDAKVTICKRQARLIVASIQSMCRYNPVLVIPRYVLELVMLAAGGAQNQAR